MARNRSTSRLRVLVYAIAITATVARPAAAILPKTGLPFTGPSVPTSAARLAAHNRALLVELRPGDDRAAGVLQKGHAKLVSAQLDLWRVPSAVARKLLPPLLRAHAVRGVEGERN